MLESYEESAERDHLLYVLTARQKTSYSQLKGIVEDLYKTLPNTAVEDGRERPITFIISQALDALGHCNFDFEGGSSTVYVCAPSLDRLPIGGPPTAVFSGARSPQTASLLVEKCEELNTRGLRIDAESASTDLPLIPNRIKIQASDESHLAYFAKEVGISYKPVPTALQLAAGLGTLEEYLQSLPEPKTGELKNWPGRRDYFPETFRFRKKTRESKGLRLVRYSHPHRGGSRYFIFYGNRRQEVDREWGRYAALRDTPLRPLVHDRRKMLVAIPNGARLPSLHARALSMCSGYAPEFFEINQISIQSKFRVPRPEQFGYHLYRWVNPRVIQGVADSLGQYTLDATIEV